MASSSQHGVVRATQHLRSPAICPPPHPLPRPVHHHGLARRPSHHARCRPAPSSTRQRGLTGSPPRRGWRTFRATTTSCTPAPRCWTWGTPARSSCSLLQLRRFADDRRPMPSVCSSQQCGGGQPWAGGGGGRPSEGAGAKGRGASGIVPCAAVPSCRPPSCAVGCRLYA